MFPDASPARSIARIGLDVMIGSNTVDDSVSDCSWSGVTTITRCPGTRAHSIRWRTMIDTVLPICRLDRWTVWIGVDVEKISANGRRSSRVIGTRRPPSAGRENIPGRYGARLEIDPGWSATVGIIRATVTTRPGKRKGNRTWQRRRRRPTN